MAFICKTNHRFTVMLAQNAVLWSLSSASSLPNKCVFHQLLWTTHSLCDAPHVANMFLSVVNCDVHVSGGGGEWRMQLNHKTSVDNPTKLWLVAMASMRLRKRLLSTIFITSNTINSRSSQTIFIKFAENSNM